MFRFGVYSFFSLLNAFFLLAVKVGGIPALWKARKQAPLAFGALGFIGSGFRALGLPLLYTGLGFIIKGFGALGSGPWRVRV